MQNIKLLVCDDDQDILTCYESILCIAPERPFLSEKDINFECHFVTQGDDAVSEVAKNMEEQKSFALIYFTEYPVSLRFGTQKIDGQ